MKKTLIALLFVLKYQSLFPQLGLKLNYIRPTGDLGMTMKPTIGGELIYKPFEEESGFNIRGQVGFAKFKSRKDTFPTYGVLSGNTTIVTPGYTVFHKYNMVTASFGVDYMIRVNDKFFLYPGVDVGIVATVVEYDDNAPLISSGGYSGGYIYVSARLRAGAEYRVIEDIGIFAEYTRSMNYSPEVGKLAYNDYGFGVRLNF